MAEAGSGIAILGGESGDDISLLDILDHVLNSGVVIHGSIVISLAGVDLVFLGLNVVLTAIETARQSAERHANKSHNLSVRMSSAARPRENR